MHTVVIVAIARIAPVEHEHRAIRSVTDFHPAEPRIRRDEEVHAMFADVATAAALKDFLIHPAAMQVEREKMLAILSGPIVALVNHHADMRMAASKIVRDSIPRLLPSFRGVEMPVVCVLIDQRVCARVRIEGVRTNEMRPGKLMPEMTIHR